MIESYKRRSNDLFREVLVAGTLGAFFVAIAQSFCIDVEAWFKPHSLSLEYSVARPLCYSYVFWFLTYFFYSTLWTRIDPHPLVWQDRSFYVIQCLFSLGATFSLGFFAEHHGSSESATSFMLANIAIGTICLTSLALFYARDTRERVQREKPLGARITHPSRNQLDLNELRATGLCIALETIAGICLLRPNRSAMHNDYQPLMIVITLSSIAIWYVLLNFRCFTVSWSKENLLDEKDVSKPPQQPIQPVKVPLQPSP
jgi:hypothetical protein